MFKGLLLIVYLCVALTVVKSKTHCKQDKGIEPAHASSKLNTYFGFLTRRIVNLVDWAAIATVSETENSPQILLTEMSACKTGIPHFYLPNTIADALTDNNASVAIAVAPIEKGPCQNEYVFEHPTCARVTFSGKLERCEPRTREEQVARRCIFEKHPHLIDRETFSFLKLNIEKIFLTPKLGNEEEIFLDSYFNTGSKPTKPEAKFFKLGLSLILAQPNVCTPITTNYRESYFGGG